MPQIPQAESESEPQSEAPVWTILQLLEWTTNYLRDHGAPSPRLDAEVLLAFARGCQRIELYMAFDQPATTEVRDRFRALVRQRATGAPVAYLVGAREFFSRSFKVSSEVLIPRPETEFVITTLLDCARQSGGAAQPFRIVDVGTGSGILAITAALELPQSQVTALDISPAARAIAEENAATHGVLKRVEFVQSDICSSLPAERSWDFVISNPPYVSHAELAGLAKDVRDFEPSLALDGGPDGLSVIRRLIPQSAACLKAGGWLILEISPMLQPAVVALIVAEEGFDTPQERRDLAHLPRVVYARRH